MGATKQIATRQINRFIPAFSFWITRSSQHTTDGRPVQADVWSDGRSVFGYAVTPPPPNGTANMPTSGQVPVVVSCMEQTPEALPRTLCPSQNFNKWVRDFRRTTCIEDTDI